MPSHPSVLFVCLHGSAKSVIAAEHFRRVAAQRGIVVDTASAGVEPDAEIPPHVVAGLGNDGFDVAGHRPRAVSGDIVGAADLVVSFGCELDAGGFKQTNARPIIRWDDVPAVSDGYDAARADIVRRFAPLLDDLQAEARDGG